jgi:hypothetical protein
VLPWCEGRVSLVVDSVGPRLTRVLVNLLFLGWGSGVAVAVGGGQLDDSLMSCKLLCAAYPTN